MPRGKIRLLASASLRRTCGLRRMSTEPKQAWSPQPPLIRGALCGNNSGDSRLSDLLLCVCLKFLSKERGMMNLIENGNFGMGPEELGADIPIAPQENFVNGVYSSVDEAIACGLDRLRREDGIIPACKLGCCHCCRYHRPDKRPSDANATMA